MVRYWCTDGAFRAISQASNLVSTPTDIYIPTTYSLREEGWGRAEESGA